MAFFFWQRICTFVSIPKANGKLFHYLKYNFNFITKLLITIFAGFNLHLLSAQIYEEDLTQPNSPLLMQLFTNASPQFFDVISNPEFYKYQIVYTKIYRNEKGIEKLENHYFNFNKKQYLYPASLVKIPLSLLAFQKMELYRNLGISIHTPVVSDTNFVCQTPIAFDPTTASGRPTLDNYAKKLLAVSDNDAYNRLYEFCGYDYIGNELHKKGLNFSRIVQRLEIPCDTLSHYYTNPMYFLNAKNDTLHKQKGEFAKSRYRNPFGEVWMGSKYYNEGFLYPFPRSFIFNNFLPLDELQQCMINFYLPEYVNKNQRFIMGKDYEITLKQYMGYWPAEFKPAYSLPLNYKKMLLIGDGSPLPSNSNIRIFNHIGRALGVLGDCAYITDEKNNVDFFISVIMYCNENDILNDDSYEYQIGANFIAELGRLVYNYELGRKKVETNYFKNLYHSLNFYK